MESLERLKKKAEKKLSAAQTLAEIEKIELEFFGRKQGVLTAILRSLSAMPEGKRRTLGEKANVLRKELLSMIEIRRDAFRREAASQELEREKIDVTFPGAKKEVGHLHPLTRIRMEAERVFTSLGFTIADGPEVETEYYNFDALNIPGDHPARDLWDTFWIANSKGQKSEYLLRTHTSPVQIRYMERHNPPFRIIAPGTAFRHEATDASHDIEFLQLEGLMVGHDISVANLKYILALFFEKMFGRKIEIRLRPSYFPFVEPGFEVDIACLSCHGKGCSVCAHSGWLELLGAGMIHQKVFEAAGYVVGEWQGFAFGIGLDRIAMMKYKIPDVRLFRQNDIRFLKQF